MSASSAQPSRSRHPLRAGLAAVAVTAALAAAPAAALSPNGLIQPGPKTPHAAVAALRSGSTVVIAFVVPGAADDDAVASMLRGMARSSGAPKGVKYLIYNVTSRPTFGDLPQVLGIEGTPTVAVIRPDGHLQNMWLGLVDQTLVRQGISSAQARTAYVAPKRRSTTRPTTTRPARSSPAGLRLAARVNRAYGAVPGVSITWTQALRGTTASFASLDALSGGRIVGGLTTLRSPSRPAISLVLTREGIHSRAAGSSCWRLTDRKAGSQIGTAFFDVARSRFAAPRRAGDALVMRVWSDGSVDDFRIDPASAVVHSVTTVRDPSMPAGTVSTVRSLANAPVIPTPSPACGKG